MTKGYSKVGRSIPRIDGREKVIGAARFGPDLRFERLLSAKLLRSPHAHARVRNIDTSAAEALPGVKAVASILEVPKVLQYWFFLRTQEKEKQIFLTDNVVRFVGDPVLAVAAETEAIAAEALKLVRVDYEVLPAILDPRAALTEERVKIHRNGNVAFRVKRELGDVDRGFAEADLIIENTFRTSKQKHASLEPIGTCVAEYGSDGRLTVHSGTQLPHWSQHYLASALDLPLSKVRVIKPFTGGAFGGRCGLIHGLEAMTAWLARKTLRPVRMSFSREEDFSATETRHPMIIRMKTGAAQDGRLLANEVEILSDTGAYGTHYIGVVADCLSTGVGLYDIPNYSFSGTVVYTNKSMGGALRGYGNPQMNFAQESQVDIIAQELNIDPLEMRLLNYRRAGEMDPILRERIRSNGLEECLTRGADSSGWSAKRSVRKEEGPLKSGIGLSVMLHGTGAARALPDPASATVLINSDGTVNLQTAAADEGQGNRTVLAQVAAEILGIDFESITVSEPDTAVTPLDCGTHGSRQAYCGGLSVREAAENARAKMLEYAAGILGVAGSAELRVESGAVFEAAKPENSMAIKDLMRRVQIGDMGSCRQIIGTASGIAPAMPGYYGAVFAEVEVDTRTGRVRVTRLTSGYDVGRAINPDLVEGQIVGGGVMGVGFALTEGLEYEGDRMVNPNLTDYRLLRAGDAPEVTPIIVESEEPTGPFGAKGIGEGSMVNVASAIANAVFQATGVRITELPITPEKVLRALRETVPSAARRFETYQ